ncbi:precorrin-6Y C5,15-methyltransferase (decarboxylating) subunit CbiT [uncultured Tessaracoccus sp.]|uniref:precorrin-6Y C5,15-methyltransferase (decarboxylating) subunit CbiT n=1 Tax=uncultured Tessaracoccus sp. TaxID=905023 RepID=UPI0025F73AF6|nr:precorrin-6Y C5,15-methyltransferase (decarboxylating) subunit CbiT [uncultured Tessaracoccus sp.]
MIADPDCQLFGRTPGLPDDAFEHDGLVTKRTHRASAIALLRPSSGELLWDVGTGAGSIAIEWCRAADGARALGVEQRPERAARARRNAERLTAPGAVRIVEGAAVDVLPGLDTPDAVFIGGGGSRAVLEHVMERVGERGRVVLHGVTLETEELCAEAYRRFGGELTRVAVEQAAPLGGLTGWTPSRTLTQWAHLPGAAATGS